MIFAGLSPFTIEGEMRGSRTEYIRWIQDVPDQKQIVSQYCRYSGELKSGKNVKHMVNRALQFATSDPKGPVYLVGAREVMEEDLEPYQLDQKVWGPVAPAALPATGVKLIATELAAAKNPLVVAGYTGRQAQAELATLANNFRGIRVLDTGGSDMCFPANHPGWLGLRYAGHELVSTADFILVIDCDVPWVPTQFKPSESARIVHVDVDPLKQQIPVFYMPSMATFRADSATSLRQINDHVLGSGALQRFIGSEENISLGQRRDQEYLKRRRAITDLAVVPEGGDDAQLSVNYLMSQVRHGCPTDTIWAIESVTLTQLVADQIAVTLPNSWINCGGGGMGWSGGGALGIKLASDVQHGGPGKGKFVVQVVGDGTYLFSVPG